MKRIDLRTSAAALVAAATITAALPERASATVIIYEELFPYAGTATQDERLEEVGWCGGNAGDPLCNNRPGDAAPADNDGGEGAVSKGNGQDGDPGFFFWSQTGIGADGFAFTYESPFSLTANTELSWWQRDSAGGADDETHLALLIGSNWYISDLGYTSSTSNAWEQFTATLIDLTYFERAQAGGALPDGGIGTGGMSLTSGADVTAFGFWWDGKKDATSRIDSIELSAIPVPAGGLLLLTGLGGLAAFRRHKKR